MHKGYRFILLSAIIAIATTARAELVINELMQSNIDCIMDDRTNFPDSWVELYNPDDQAVSTTNYAISIAENSGLYNLPIVTIPAHGYKLIYCDKENTNWHTSFRLESGKNAAVYLYRNGVVVDQITGIKKQPAPNISYGRSSDGSATWGYQLTPTPEASNTGITNNPILGEVLFSQPGQVFTGNTRFLLILSAPEGTPADAVIRYTLDGSEPTQTNGETFSSDLVISRTTLVRAKIMCDGYLSPRSTTHSYIYLNRNATLPIVSIVTNQQYFTDRNIGIYVDGPDPNNKNYNQDWRRPINFEYFPAVNTNAELNQLCETRIQGNASRGAALKSLALYANKRFGEKRFDYEFFPDQKPGLRDFKSIMLRNAGNDFDYLYMRDAIIQRAMATYQDLDWQAWRPVICFINGEYKGILNIRERSNDDNIYSNYNGLEDITMMENTWELKAGEWQTWSDFQAWSTTRGHTLAEYEQVWDVNEWMNHTIMEIFFNNQDWPGNNMVFWRPNASGGKWRVIAKDTDFGLGLYGTSPSYNTWAWFYNPDYDGERNWANTYEHTRMFRYAMEVPDFQRAFTDKAAIYVGDFLNINVIEPMWDAMYAEIATEYPIHRQLYNAWWPNYQNEMTSAKNWLRRRPDFFIRNMAAQYNLGDLSDMAINQGLTNTEREQVQINFSGIDLTQHIWAGQYFRNRLFTLTATPTDQMPADYTIAGWNVTTYTNGVSGTTFYAGDSLTFTIPQQCISVRINTLISPLSTLNEVSTSFPSQQAMKTIEDGQLLIIRDGHRYNALGQRLK